MNPEFANAVVEDLKRHRTRIRELRLIVTVQSVAIGVITAVLIHIMGKL